MKIRAAFAKEDEAKFIGHLDLTRVFERAMRRAGIPMAFSEGFNPHPKLAFGSALALGATSLREYVDIELSLEMLPSEFMHKLQGQLPRGLTLLEAEEIPDQSRALMAVLNCSGYRVRVPLLLPLAQERVDSVLERFLEQESIAYVRYSKKGRQEKNLRPFIRSLKGHVSSEYLELEMEIDINEQGSVKPQELVGVLREFGELPLDVDGIRVHRTGIYIWSEDGIRSPLDKS